MSINEKTLKNLLKKNNLVGNTDLENSAKVANHLGCSIVDVLIGRDLLTEEDLGKLLALHYKTEFIDLNRYDIDISALKLIPEEFAQSYGVVAFRKNNDTVHIALEDPHELEIIELIKKTIGKSNKIIPCVATKIGIKNALKLYSSRLAKDVDETKVELTESSPVTILEKLLEDAVQEEASDIHIEPMEEALLVRFRVDGVLHDEKLFDKSLHPSIVARLKILTDMKLDETRLPQDGQFSIITKRNEKVSFRVSVIPSVNGEKVVLRLLESALTRFNLEELGLLPEDQEIATKALHRTHGMFLVTGPTGSGKTTTLYTALGLLNSPEVNIVTIEDPVENKIKRLTQIQVNSQINLSFASGLRSVLRQDPDIVMVGEIRDHETAVIATNSAMTGHLVFSTVHANTAAGAIPRMIDLGVEPFLVASTLNMVIAQRLVRVLCPKCKREAPLSLIVKDKLDGVKDNVSKDILKMLKNYYEPVGCNACHDTGFKGRIGIFELIIVDGQIREMIAQKATSDEIEKSVRRTGAKTMLEDGIIKVAKGATTLDEVFRVISQ
jgi:type IV pilus assembly protein PilB